MFWIVLLRRIANLRIWLTNRAKSLKVLGKKKDFRRRGKMKMITIIITIFANARHSRQSSNSKEGWLLLLQIMKRKRAITLRKCTKIFWMWCQKELLLLAALGSLFMRTRHFRRSLTARKAKSWIFYWI